MSRSQKPDPTPFERMQALATSVLSVPKAEIDRRETEWRKAKALKRSKKK